MDYTYTIQRITVDSILVDYEPPPELVLKTDRLILSFVLEADTTEAEIIARVESAVPVEDWEAELDRRDNARSDVSALIGVTTPVTIPDVSARSQKQRRADQLAAATPPPPPVLEV